MIKKILKFQYLVYHTRPDFTEGFSTIPRAHQNFLLIFSENIVQYSITWEGRAFQTNEPYHL
jgi:hypothetical protein